MATCLAVTPFRYAIPAAMLSLGEQGCVVLVKSISDFISITLAVLAIKGALSLQQLL
jgi:hypothetical protein